MGQRSSFRAFSATNTCVPTTHNVDATKSTSHPSPFHPLSAPLPSTILRLLNSCPTSLPHSSSFHLGSPFSPICSSYFACYPYDSSHPRCFSSPTDMQMQALASGKMGTLCVLHTSSHLHILSAAHSGRSTNLLPSVACQDCDFSLLLRQSFRATLGTTHPDTGGIDLEVVSPRAMDARRAPYSLHSI